MALQPLLVWDILQQAAGRAPDRPAVSLRALSISFRDLLQLGDRVSRALLARGVGRGDRVVWQAENSIEAVALFFATARIGAVFAPINPAAPDEEARRLIARAEARLVLGLPAPPGGMAWQEMLDGLDATPASDADWPVVDEEDVHAVYFTSGTTGEPKGCMLSQRAEYLRACVGPPWPTGPLVSMFPQFHMAAWAHPLEAWLAGNAVVYVARPDARNLLDAVARHQAARLYCIPAVWRRLMEEPTARTALLCLRRADTGTSAVTPELLAGIAAICPNAQTSIVYGATETNLVFVLGPEDLARKPGSVGRPGPGVEVRIDGEGELLVRAPTLFSGYFRDEAATRGAFDGTWFRTGDLATRDGDGDYAIIGRRSSLIRTGGETVAPAEVEDVLKTHPAIADLAIAGVPSADWGEIIVAFAVMRAGMAVGLTELRAHCIGRLAPHKHPRQLVVVEQIPRTAATGQIQRRLLLETLGGAVGATQAAQTRNLA